MNNKVTVTGVNVLFLIFYVAFIFFQIVLTIISNIFDLKLFDQNIYVILLINEFILILVPVLIYTLAKRLNMREVFKLNKLGILPSLLIAAIAVPAYFTAAMLNNIVAYLLQFIGEIPEQPIPVPQSIPELIIGILIIGVSPAICEELLHRGLLLKAYENRGSLKAVVITSIFFGVFHMDIMNLVGPIFLGLLIGYYVIRTNSIFAGILAHFLNNTIAELISFFSRGVYEGEAKGITLPDLGYIIILGIAGLIIVLVLLGWFNYVTENSSRIKPSISKVKGDLISILSHWPVIITLIIYIFITALTLLMIFSGNFT